MGGLLCIGYNVFSPPERVGNATQRIDHGYADRPVLVDEPDRPTKPFVLRFDLVIGPRGQVGLLRHDWATVE